MGRSQDPSRPTRIVVCVVGIILALDVGLAVGLAYLVDDKKKKISFSMRQDVNDLVGLALARTVVLPSLGFLAYSLWWLRTRAPEGYRALEDRDDVEALSKSKAAADFRRDVALAFLFVASSVCQGYIGVKMCLFDYDHRDTRVLAALMGATTVLVNVEAWLLSNLVRLRTRLLTTRVPSLHKHPLALAASTNNWCDVCDQRITDAYMWRCNACNFDACQKCYARAISSSATGLNNTDPSSSSSSFSRGGGGVSSREESVPLAEINRPAFPRPSPSRLLVETESEITSTEILRRTARLVAPDWALVAIALACVFAAGATGLALPSFQGRIIDSVYACNRRQFRRRLVLYLAFSIGAAVTSSLRAFCFQATGRRLACALRNRLYAAIVRQDVAFFDNVASGTLTSRLTQDVNQMTMPLTTLLGTLTSSLIQLCGGVAMAFYTSWRLSMLAFTTVGPIMHITQAYAAWSREQNRKILSHLGEANAVATESLANIRTVKSAGTDAFEIDRFEQHTIAARDRGVVDAALSSSTQLINNVLDYGAGWLILFYGGALAMRDGSGLSAGSLVTYQLYFTKIQTSYNSLISLLSSFTRASGAAQRVLGILAALPTVDPDAGRRLLDPPRGALDFEDVHFAYESRPDKFVLRNFTLSVPAGTTLAMVGRSGSGKSTALNLALRFYDAQRGAVRLDGVPLAELNMRDFRRYCGVVAQSTELFDTTIAANIKYGTPDVSDAEVVAAARAALAHDFIVDFPNQYATRIGERGVRISGGQRQRLAIARAFLRRPKILLLDEATSALDAESEAKVQQSLDALISRGGSTVMLVAHRLSTVRNADAIAVLSDGHIVELGNHDHLMARPDGIYKMLVTRQLEASANALEDSHVDSAATEVDRLLLDQRKSQKAVR
ncbi:hypothetical protein CTAYLR_006089 [Chrysophaeum taylorii]|uniref:Uncharacterized protein n=1 Tax=Chrysophaeum taylorii TaxID=2483200 RepID=A0AAD7U9M3_9STRA|nr:hypothetical protein CTAYLR_006089 [Chrysophaeum taylorii]